MTVLARPARASRAAAAGRGAGERDQLGRIPRDLWEALAADEDARARYYGKVYWRGPGQCAYFLGALSSGGHGRFRAGTRRAAADRPGSLVVPAHIYGYVLSRGVPGPDPVTGCLPVIRHRCDEPSCQAAMHLAAGSPAENSRDYLARRANPYSPLGDRRGPRGRAVPGGDRGGHRGGVRGWHPGRPAGAVLGVLRPRLAASWPGPGASAPGPQRSLAAEPVELPGPHAPEECAPLVRREPENGAFGVLAVANADPAVGQARHLDAVAVGETQRTFDPGRF